MKTKFLLLMILLGICVPASAQESVPAEISENSEISEFSENSEKSVPAESVPAITQDERMQWWRDAKFGMFIHFGLYSGLAGQWRGEPKGSEWIQLYANADTDTYAAEALPLFRPKKDCARKWAELAKLAGCKYAVLTTKHHEGFALFETATSDYSAPATINRDIVREYVDAFRGNGLRVGFYHSLIDWHQKDFDYTINPDFAFPQGQALMLKQKFIPPNQEAYKRYLAAQVRELLTNYGQIDVIWWDYSQDSASGDRMWGATDLMKLCRELQPKIIMNNRLFAYSGLDSSAKIENFDTQFGDFVTPERHIPQRGYAGTDWESCQTVGEKWGYNRYDTKFKSAETLIRKLQECAAKGGNLLLNINPRADGSVPAPVELAFIKIGEWLAQNGEAIYATRPFFEATDAAGTPLLATQSADGNAIFVFVPENVPEMDLHDFQVLISGVPAKFERLSSAGTLCPVLKIVK